MSRRARTRWNRREPQTAPEVAVDEEATALLNWMEQNAGQHTVCIGGKWYVRSGYGQPHIRAGNLRAAIRAAMAAQKGGA